MALSRVPDDWKVKIFIGRTQNTIPFQLASDAQRLGNRLEWIKIEGDGRNNLDFHLAYYLGGLAMETPNAEFFILSKDKGFDPLLKHIAESGGQCRRISDFAAIVAAPIDPHFTRAFEVLSKIDKKSRPRRRKTLHQHIASIFQKKLEEAEIHRIVESLIVKGLVAETNNVLTYHF